MTRYLSGLANAALFVLCCSLVADTANAVFAALLAPVAAEVESAPAPAAPRARSWNDRQVILKRNLFNASLLAPAHPVAEEPEQLEATRLPLALVGTAVSEDPALSLASVADRDQRKTLLLRVNDELRDQVKVARIERRRVVILEKGALRELVFDEEDTPPAPPPRTRRRTPSRRRSSTARRAAPPGQRVRKLSEDRFAVPRSDVREATGNPASLLSQARILPKYQDGAMVGLQINAIKPGSLFEQVGMENGDVVREVNGIRIDGAEDNARFLAEFADSSELSVVVEGSDGEMRTLHFTVPED